NPMRAACIFLVSVAAFGATPSPQYSGLLQINRENVGRLAVAWKYDTGDAFNGSENQCRPLFADGKLYVTSPKNRLLALEADTGRVLWSFDPSLGAGVRSKVRTRGLTMWTSGSKRRIFYAHGPDLWAIDAATGKPVPGFGTEGRIDLREGLGRDPKNLTV